MTYTVSSGTLNSTIPYHCACQWCRLCCINEHFVSCSLPRCVLGLFASFMYIVDHAMQLGVSKTRAAMLLSLLGASSVVSRLAVGCVADMPSVDSVALYTVALWVAGASTCTLPSLRSYQLLCGYQLVYGACCGTTYKICTNTLQYSRKS